MAAGGAQLESSGEPQRPGSRAAPLTVTQLVRGTTRVLERTIGTIYVTGEVSSYKRAASGHLYFALSDGRSSLPCVMWRADAARLKAPVEPGVVLVCRGRLGVYERDGKFQLYVSAAEPAGLGADALAFEKLRRTLAAEGLFDVARKRPVPRLPRRIGVVTSKSGAALRDIVRAVQRRFPLPILVADCRVQGADAPRTIARALRALCATDVDVIIVGRGGGSSGDLSAFNDERVVRAVAECPVPIISAVGHEVDVSLTDLAADVRAATPTMAGEMAVPVYDELLEQLVGQERRLAREIAHTVRAARQELDQLTALATRCTEQGLGRRRRALAELAHALAAQHPRARLVAHRAELGALAERVDAIVQRRVAEGRRELGDLARRLDATMARRLEASRQELGSLGRHLAAVSPLAVLDRGYALATVDGQVVRRAGDVEVGDELHLRLADGSLECEIRARSDER